MMCPGETSFSGGALVIGDGTLVIDAAPQIEQRD
jgi:hypothetical protein